jgi:CRP-like cAMP-binding protein
MTLVEAEDLDPYPGEFLRDTLDDKILKTNLILALDYLADQRIEDTKETIRNIWLAKTKAVPSDNPFEAYIAFQRRWRELRKLTRREFGPEMYEIIVAGNVRLEEEARITEALREKFDETSYEDIRELVMGFPLFNGLSRMQVDSLIALGKREFYVKDDILFSAGTKGHNLLIILRGRAVIMMSNHSDEVIGVAEAGVGETLGEVSMLIGATHAASVIALEPMEVLCFTRSSLTALMANEPELAAKLWHSMAQSLGNRLRDSNARYMSSASETQDVADELIQTGPLDVESAEEPRVTSRPE